MTGKQVFYFPKYGGLFKLEYQCVINSLDDTMLGMLGGSILSYLGVPLENLETKPCWETLALRIL